MLEVEVGTRSADSQGAPLAASGADITAAVTMEAGAGVGAEASTLDWADGVTLTTTVIRITGAIRITHTVPITATILTRTADLMLRPAILRLTILGLAILGITMDIRSHSLPIRHRARAGLRRRNPLRVAVRGII